MKDDKKTDRLSAVSRQPSAMILWLAQGFGVGRIPFAPGTFGSILGLGWFALLLLPGNFWIYLAGTIFGLGISVWLCGAGEKILNQKDPGSVVMDEIAAMPVCFVWIVTLINAFGGMPSPQAFFEKQSWVTTICVFVAFRIFDIWKPWPVRQSQRLPGGLGVTVDDVLAAIYVNILSTGVLSLWAAIFGLGIH